MADLVNDMTPNDSEALGVYEPDEEQAKTPEQTNEEVQERQTVTSMVPILKELFEWFDEMIDGADSVTQLKTTLTKFKSELKGDANNAMVAHHIVASMLEDKKQELATRFENFLQARDVEREENQAEEDTEEEDDGTTE